MQYNNVPAMKKKFKDVTESEYNKWLSNADFAKLPPRKYKINLTDLKSIVNSSKEKSNAFVLPLSIEDNATIAGTASLPDDFAAESGLPSCNKNPELLLFDSVKGNFDIKLARTRFEYLSSQYRHQSYIADLQESLISKEKKLDGVTTNDLLNEAFEDKDDTDEDTVDYGSPEKDNISCTLQSENHQFRKEDEDFWKLYNCLATEVDSIHGQLNYEEHLLGIIEKFSKQGLEEIQDHLKRTLLHVSVEKGHNHLAKCIIYSGFNVNVKEGCGLTPLHLGLVSGNIPMSLFLLERNAKFDGPSFSALPSPKDVATKLNLQSVLELMNEKQNESDDEDKLISNIDHLLKHSQLESTDCLLKEAELPGITKSGPGLITPLVGDVGTCKTNQAVMARSCAYDWVGICMGDMHNKGYFCEACFKQHGS